MQHEHKKTTLAVSEQCSQNEPLEQIADDSRKYMGAAPRVEHYMSDENNTSISLEQQSKLYEIWLNDPLEIDENNYHPLECSILIDYTTKLADKYGTLDKALDKYGDLKLAISEQHRSIAMADKMAALALHQMLKVNDTHAVMRVVDGWIYYYVTDKNEYTQGVFVLDDCNRATHNTKVEIRRVIRRLEDEIEKDFLILSNSYSYLEN